MCASVHTLECNLPPPHHPQPKPLSFFLLFCWLWLFPLGEPKSRSHDWNFHLFLSKMDIVEIEAFSFIRQEISCRLMVEADGQNRSPLSQSVIDPVVAELSYLAPTANQCFRTLVVRLALNVHLSRQYLGEYGGSPILVTPH